MYMRNTETNSPSQKKNTEKNRAERRVYEEKLCTIKTAPSYLKIIDEKTLCLYPLYMFIMVCCAEYVQQQKWNKTFYQKVILPRRFRYII